MVEELDLDTILAEASLRTQKVPPALMSRIIADADLVQAERIRFRSTVKPVGGWLEVLADWFGGGFSLAGMMAAVAVGVYLGVAQPTAVLTLADLVTGTATIDNLDVLPAADAFWAQE